MISKTSINPKMITKIVVIYQAIHSGLTYSNPQPEQRMLWGLLRYSKAREGYWYDLEDYPKVYMSVEHVKKHYHRVIYEHGVFWRKPRIVFYFGENYEVMWFDYKEELDNFLEDFMTKNDLQLTLINTQ